MLSPSLPPGYQCSIKSSLVWIWIWIQILALKGQLLGLCVLQLPLIQGSTGTGTGTGSLSGAATDGRTSRQGLGGHDSPLHSNKIFRHHEHSLLRHRLQSTHSRNTALVLLATRIHLTIPWILQKLEELKSLCGTIVNPPALPRRALCSLLLALSLPSRSSTLFIMTAPKASSDTLNPFSP